MTFEATADNETALIRGYATSRSWTAAGAAGAHQNDRRRAQCRGGLRPPWSL